MKLSKLTRFAITGMMTCSMALTTIGTMATAAPVIATVNPGDTNLSDKLPAEVTVKVNKLAFKDASSTPQDNTGGLMDYIGADPLPGVEFKMYDVRAVFDAIKADDPTLKNDQIMAMITGDWDTYKAGAVDKGNATTNSAGVATFSGVKTRQADGAKKYALYLFEELPSAANAGNDNYFMSPPFVAGFPIKNEAGKHYKTVNLYAKNSGIEKDLVAPGENGGQSGDGGNTWNFEVGKTVTYKANVNIPHHISDTLSDGSYKYSSLIIRDEMTTSGTDFVGIKKITAGSTDVTTLFNNLNKYTDSNQDGWTGNAGFEYNIPLKGDGAPSAAALTALLDAIKGESLTFEYEMKINDQAVPTEDIGNGFQVTFDGKTIVDVAQDIETGGYKFKKYDTEDDSALAGAKFIISRVKNGVTQYAQFYYGTATTPSTGDTSLVNANGTYTPAMIDWTIIEDDATKITSGTLGNLQINGLGSGNYKLIETDAPEGYKLPVAPANETAFTIKLGSDGFEALTQNNQLHKDVANTPDDGLLPTTGGTGIAAFLIMGTAAMGTAVYYKKRRA
ncbi:SpaH/EbpB family LPXTG-anchored major pilin [Lacticaseibacillus daqingensis]|uniref:SpaH/EbpB family LPXTG-anchored major pilin n=1 Tax=Lacticaseibacillus daqingensis TaxID=2486014 RepID=UPI000F7A53E1|nr:SpaH/EbpB family LPXTG-anchored major pilin [Lacticaseibacillus daqingensis]